MIAPAQASGLSPGGEAGSVKVRGRKLLILGGRARTQSSTNVGVPAIERFDGREFQHVRKLLAEGEFPRGVDVYVLTTRFGLVAARDYILPDDQLTDPLATHAQTLVAGQIDALIRFYDYDEVYICAPDMHGRMLSKSVELRFSAKIRVTRLAGNPGIKFKHLSQWLTYQRAIEAGVWKS